MKFRSYSAKNKAILFSSKDYKNFKNTLVISISSILDFGEILRVIWSYGYERAQEQS